MRDQKTPEEVAAFEASIGVVRDPVTGKPRIPIVEELTAHARSFGLDVEVFVRLAIVDKHKRVHFHRKLAARLEADEHKRKALELLGKGSP